MDQEDSQNRSFADLGSDWVLNDTKEPAADAIAYWITEEEWRKGSTGEREPCLSWQIKQRHTPSSAPVTVDSWSAKSSELDCETALEQALTEILAPIPEPARLILLVARSPLPEHRSPDSTTTFYIVNSAWMSANGGEQHTGGMPAMPTMGPAPMLAGPSPIAAIMRPNAGAPSGITGDIGGTGIANLVTGMADALTNLMTMAQNVLTFAADMNARTTQMIAQQLQRHPDAQAEQARLDHEYRMKQLESEQEHQLEKAREVGGVAKELGAKLLDNPALGAIGLTWAKKNGIQLEDIAKLMKGEL